MVIETAVMVAMNETANQQLPVTPASARVPIVHTSVQRGVIATLSVLIGQTRNIVPMKV